MIGEESDRVTGALEVVAPMIQSMDDCKQLVIVDVIVTFGRGECCRNISTQMEVSITVALHKNSPTGKEGGISHNHEGVLNIREMENWGSLEVGQQHRKGSLLVRSPSPGLIFMG